MRIEATSGRQAAWFVALAFMAMGCASIGTPGDGYKESARAPAATVATFATIDEAAINAFVDARARSTTRDRHAIRVGTIQRVEGGFTFTPSRASASLRSSRSTLGVRLTLTDLDVATYIVHPPTGSRSVDRANQELSESERHILERADPLHRPIFLLTPRLDVVRFVAGSEPDSIASLRRQDRWDRGIATVSVD